MKLCHFKSKFFQIIYFLKTACLGEGGGGEGEGAERDRDGRGERGVPCAFLSRAHLRFIPGASDKMIHRDPVVLQII